MLMLGVGRIAAPPVIINHCPPPCRIISRQFIIHNKPGGRNACPYDLTIKTLLR